MPQPGNPQALNRYSYVANSPLKYIDPSGHDWQGFWNSVGQFFGQALYQWVRSNREGVIILPMSPQEQEVWDSLKVDTDEGRAGRIVGGLAAAVQGVVEFGAGAGAIGGGVAACGTGVLCVAGAPAIAAGAAGVVHGGGTAISGVGAAGNEIGWFLAQAGSGGGRPIITIPGRQFGQKAGKHMPEWGLDPSNAADRAKFLDTINEFGANPDKVVPGSFSGQGGPGLPGPVLFWIRGNDVVITQPDGTFVSILKDGINNSWVQAALGGTP